MTDIYKRAARLAVRVEDVLSIVIALPVLLVVAVILAAYGFLCDTVRE